MNIENTEFDWKKLPDGYGTRYDQRVSAQEGIYYERYYDLLNRTVELCNLTSDDDVLEIGCGTGSLTKLLSQRGVKSLTAIDPSPQMLEEARAKSIRDGWDKNVRFECISDPFLSVPSSDGKFSAVASTFAFHHVSDVDKLPAIKEMSRILKPGGRLVIGDVMFANAEAKKAGLLLWKELEDEPFALLDELSTQFSQGGFTFQFEQISRVTWVVLGVKQ